MTGLFEQKLTCYIHTTIQYTVQSARVVEYNDCISAEG